MGQGKWKVVSGKWKILNMKRWVCRGESEEGRGKKTVEEGSWKWEARSRKQGVESKEWEEGSEKRGVGRV